jgi:L-lactate dehydrogenase (cytochrome)
MPKLLNFHDYRAVAQKKLPRGLFEYIDRGTEDETGIARHRADLDAISVTPSMLTGHHTRNLATEIFGCRIEMPVAVAPTALAGLVSYQGEEKFGRAVEATGIPYCVSTQSVTTIEDIRAAAPDANLWFQLYVWHDRKLTHALLDRVRACSISTLVVTADTPVMPNREYNIRNGFTVPMAPSVAATLDLALHPGWVWNVFLRYLRTSGTPVFAHYPDGFRASVTRPAVAKAVQIEYRLNWDDIAELRRQWKGELVVKGLLSPADALRAAELGADSIVVSTHGARNLDMAPSTARALPPIVDAVGHRLTVLADSCVQRGSDVLRYMSLGAKAVLLGRMPLYGLAAGDEAGVKSVLAMLRNEIDLTLALLGREDVASLLPHKDDAAPFRKEVA